MTDLRQRALLTSSAGMKAEYHGCSSSSSSGRNVVGKRGCGFTLRCSELQEGGVGCKQDSGARGASVFSEGAASWLDEEPGTASLRSHTSDADTQIQCKYSHLMSAVNVIPAKPTAAPGLCIASQSAAFIPQHFCTPSLARGKAAEACSEDGTEGSVCSASAFPLPLRAPAYAHTPMPALRDLVTTCPS